MDLNEVVVFIKVVELGSFTKAAHQLAMPISTVSAKVSDLETRLGVTLIRRTTRKLFVTPEAQLFFERCTRGVDEIREAEEEVKAGQREPQGLLRLTAPIELGSTVLPKVMIKFRQLYPKVQLEVNLSDQTVDLIAAGYDLAVRAGALKDSTLRAKKLGDVYFAPFASAGYLKKAGSPKSPKDLKDHCCLQFSPMGIEEWKLVGPKPVSVPMKGQIVVNELNAIKSLTVSGQGIALLPTFLCFSEVQAGKLVRVLPEWRSDLRPVNFVYAAQKQNSLKVTAFISIAAGMIRESLQSFEL